MVEWTIAVVLVLVASGAIAQASVSKGPFDFALWSTYAWVIGISALGGLVSFYRKVKSGAARAWNISELIGELATSGLAGIITYWFCQWGEVNPWLAAAFIGIAGHMGSRLIFMAEGPLERWLGRMFPNNT